MCSILEHISVKLKKAHFDPKETTNSTFQRKKHDAGVGMQIPRSFKSIKY